MRSRHEMPTISTGPQVLLKTTLRHSPSTQALRLAFNTFPYALQRCPVHLPFHLWTRHPLTMISRTFLPTSLNRIRAGLSNTKNAGVPFRIPAA